MRHELKMQIALGLMSRHRRSEEYSEDWHRITAHQLLVDGLDRLLDHVDEAAAVDAIGECCEDRRPRVMFNG